MAFYSTKAKVYTCSYTQTLLLPLECSGEDNLFCLRRLLMKKLKEFYHKYKDYGLVDGLMYLSFFLFLALLFLFFA